MKRKIRLILGIIFMLISSILSGCKGVKSSNQSMLVYTSKNGRLIYAPYTPQGDIIPDFSNVGFMGGDKSIPEVAIVKTMVPGSDNNSDDTARIQKAIDEIAQLPLDKDGFRGAILFTKGRYYIKDTINISASGIVLKGEGQGENDTVFIATGKKQYDLIKISGIGRLNEVKETRQKITTSYVPVGTHTFEVQDTSIYSVGDKIVVFRPSTKEWIHDIGMDSIPTKNNPGVVQWSPDSYNFHFERTIKNIEGNNITIDAPIVNVMEDKYGGGYIYKFVFEGRINNVGVENIRLESEFNRSMGDKDEQHAWVAISFDKFEDGWVNNVTSRYFGGGLVCIDANAKRITVNNCSCLDPISLVSGGRRYSFNIDGQLNLVKGCYSRNARHDFALGSRTLGPNVFVDCKGENTLSSSEPHHRWACGGLWDNVSVEGERAMFLAVNRGDSGSGHGWAGAQMVFWNCRAPLIVVMKPPTAQNFTIGISGFVEDETVISNIKATLDWLFIRSGMRFEYKGSPVMGDGFIESPEGSVTPKSLYYQQLKNRKSELQKK